MEETVAVRDVMDRSYVGVNEGDTVAGAAGLMDEEGVDSAVVLRGDDPVGLLRAIDVVSLVAEGDDPEATTVGSAMIDSSVSIAADAPLDEAVDAIAGDGIRRAIVTEDGAVEGLLADHDIVTTRAILSSTGEMEEERTGAESASDSDVYGNQGVCEVCGSLSRDLADHNGQIVCADCLAVQ